MAFSGQKISAGYLKAYKMSCISITFLTQCELMFPGLPIDESQLHIGQHMRCISHRSVKSLLKHKYSLGAI